MALTDSRTHDLVELLDNKRRELGETQTVFLERLGCKDASTYSKVKSGELPVPAKWLPAIPALLGLPEAKVAELWKSHRTRRRLERNVPRLSGAALSPTVMLAMQYLHRGMHQVLESTDDLIWDGLLCSEQPGGKSVSRIRLESPGVRSVTGNVIYHVSAEIELCLMDEGVWKVYHASLTCVRLNEESGLPRWYAHFVRGLGWSKPTLDRTTGDDEVLYSTLSMKN